MTAIDRAFIRAYDDSDTGAAGVVTGEHEPRTAAATSTRPRSKSAASQETAKPVQRPKMVVGRKALQTLVASSAAPSAHGSVAQTEIISPANHGSGEPENPGLGKTSPRSEEAESVELSAAPRAPAPRRYRVDRQTARNVSRASLSAARGGEVECESPQVIVAVDRSATQQAPSTLRPELEVDRLCWPAICEKLLSVRGHDLRVVVDKIEQRAASGGQIIAVASTQAREGCTTVLLCLARALAERNRGVCLVDANLGRPELAAQLGLSPQVGWDSAVAGECSLADALIESQADGITILPLVSSHPADGLPTLQKGGVLEQLRATFDILLIDAGALPTDGSGEASSPAIRQLADACLLVKKQAAGTRLVQQACHQLEQWNIPLVGLIENRCRV